MVAQAIAPANGATSEVRGLTKAERQYRLDLWDFLKMTWYRLDGPGIPDDLREQCEDVLHDGFSPDESITTEELKAILKDFQNLPEHIKEFRLSGWPWRLPTTADATCDVLSGPMDVVELQPLSNDGEIMAYRKPIMESSTSVKVQIPVGTTREQAIAGIMDMLDYVRRNWRDIQNAPLNMCEKYQREHPSTFIWRGKIRDEVTVRTDY